MRILFTVSRNGDKPAGNFPISADNLVEKGESVTSQANTNLTAVFSRAHTLHRTDPRPDPPRPV